MISMEEIFPLWRETNHFRILQALGKEIRPPHKFRELHKQFQEAHGPVTLRSTVHEPDDLQNPSSCKNL